MYKNIDSEQNSTCAVRCFLITFTITLRSAVRACGTKSFDARPPRVDDVFAKIFVKVFGNRVRMEYTKYTNNPEFTKLQNMNYGFGYIRCIGKCWKHSKNSKFPFYYLYKLHNSCFVYFVYFVYFV